MSALRAIHAKRRVLGYEADEDAWRDILERVTGQRSAKGLTPKQAQAVCDELDRLGAGKAPSSPARTRLEGPYAKKLQALWLLCWNLGLVESRKDEALAAFAVRQTGLGHASWVREHRDAVAVIEALKAMLERGGGELGAEDARRARAPGRAGLPHRGGAVAHRRGLARDEGVQLRRVGPGDDRPAGARGRRARLDRGDERARPAAARDAEGGSAVTAPLTHAEKMAVLTGLVAARRRSVRRNVERGIHAAEAGADYIAVLEAIVADYARLGTAEAARFKVLDGGRR